MKVIPSIAPSTLSAGGIIITLGIAFGAIGTSPLYVMEAIPGVSQGFISTDTIIGAISCIIWTLTLQTAKK